MIQRMGLSFLVSLFSFGIFVTIMIYVVERGAST